MDGGRRGGGACAGRRKVDPEGLWAIVGGVWYLLPIIGAVFVAEVVSDIIQIVYFSSEADARKNEAAAQADRDAKQQAKDAAKAAA